MENVSRNASLVCTDGWASYAELNNLGYTHETVIHKNNFINPELFYDSEGNGVKFYYKIL